MIQPDLRLFCRFTHAIYRILLPAATQSCAKKEKQTKRRPESAQAAVCSYVPFSDPYIRTPASISREQYVRLANTAKHAD